MMIYWGRCMIDVLATISGLQPCCSNYVFKCFDTFEQFLSVLIFIWCLQSAFYLEQNSFYFIFWLTIKNAIFCNDWGNYFAAYKISYWRCMVLFCGSVKCIPLAWILNILLLSCLVLHARGCVFQFIFCLSDECPPFLTFVCLFRHKMHAWTESKKLVTTSLFDNVEKIKLHPRESITNKLASTFGSLVLRISTYCTILYQFIFLIFLIMVLEVAFLQEML